MKNSRKAMAAITFAAALSVTSITAFAAAYGSPAEAAAGLTGKSLETVLSEHWDGKTYGSMAEEEGKLEEFQAAVYELHEERLKQDVADGKLTQEEADEILETLKERQETCDGTGNGGAGLGRGRGIGRGQGGGRGMGIGGMGLQDGSCYVTR